MITSQLVFMALCPQFRMPPVRNSASWFLRPDCAPSLVCTKALIAACRRAAGSIRISRRPSCCCTSAIAGIAIGANFKIYLLRQFCSNGVKFFTIHRRHKCKKMMNQNFEIWILWFLRIFWNFQKGRGSLCGRSGPYGHGQTRSQ